MPELDLEIANDAPSSNRIASCDEKHFITYARLLDAEAEGDLLLKYSPD